MGASAAFLPQARLDVVPNSPTVTKKVCITSAARASHEVGVRAGKRYDIREQPSYIIIEHWSALMTRHSLIYI